MKTNKKQHHTSMGRVDVSLTRYIPHRSGRASFSHPALCKVNYSQSIAVNTDIDTGVSNKRI